MATRLAGKAAIVTGGGGGIGRAICQVFARQGASVAILDVDPNGMQETLKPMMDGDKHCMIKCDVSSSDQIMESYKKAEQFLGNKVDIVVNNAGITRHAYLADMTEKMYDDVMTVNAKSVFLMCREFINSLRNSDSPGSIINISSQAGKNGMEQQSNYAASKGAIVAMTKSMAKEYGRFNIRCNALAPGVTETPIIAGAPPQMREMYLQKIPIGRIASPEEIANACLFLASDDSSYVNGTCLEVAGGLGA